MPILDLSHTTKYHLQKLNALMFINNWSEHNIKRFKKSKSFFSSIDDLNIQARLLPAKIPLCWLEDLWRNRDELFNNSLLVTNNLDVKNFRESGFIYIPGIGGLRIKDNVNIGWWKHRKTEIRFNDVTENYSFSPQQSIAPIDILTHSQNLVEAKQVIYLEKIFLSGSFTPQELRDIADGKLQKV